MNIILYLVVPCYNEQEILPETVRQLSDKYDQLIHLGKIAGDSKIVLVNDGSKDSTWSYILTLHQQFPRFIGINLSRNYGHQYALLAGMTYCKDKADVLITIDADLQDDINAMDDMLDKYIIGCDVVFGVRNNRKSDSFLKRVTANAFYRLMKVLGTETIYNHADFRLMSRRTLVALEQYTEVNVFLRGIIPLMGYKTDNVYYTRNARLAGKTKYPPRKILSLAWEGITSFSMHPMHLISFLGITIFTFSIAMQIYILVRYFSGHTVVGWASVAIAVWSTGGLILFCMGIIGEYIGKIYMETKKRPRYLVETILDNVVDDK